MNMQSLRGIFPKPRKLKMTLLFICVCMICMQCALYSYILHFCSVDISVAHIYNFCFGSKTKSIDSINYSFDVALFSLSGKYFDFNLSMFSRFILSRSNRSTTKTRFYQGKCEKFKINATKQSIYKSNK